ncbi:hypothetical protein H0H81_008327 [Sphagnurus paluster]|uniref:Protein kinase domain-containing protein n=1 Tax=Sphagnurus paluster TaxID=117069 RepID=A0A9P7GNS0_9AGAR|nr:hypothetical protein H0H81_008327 [Sphagnurus paluster]
MNGTSTQKYESDRGVYLAYDFLSSDQGCLQPTKVFIKAWSTPNDAECIAERTAYDLLHESPLEGIAQILMSAYDPHANVFAIALQRLGPTLDDIMQTLPEKRFDERMIERYKEIHKRGVIHNGIKPANICLPPTMRGTLHVIDFGFSSVLSAHEKLPGGSRVEALGNRRFLSVFAHHGITQSQRDDLESLAYLLSFLAHGYLPWDDPLPNSTRRRKFETNAEPQPQLWRVKMATPAARLFEGMDSSFVDFWKDIKGLAFGEVPDYDGMRDRFVGCWEQRGYGGEYNWGDLASRVGG